MYNKNFTLFFIIMLVASTIAIAQVDPRTENLTHSWTFDDGTTVDTIGGVTGVLMGGAQVLSGSLFTTQTSSWMELPANDIGINNYSEVSVEVWFKSVLNGNTGFHMLASFGNTQNTIGVNYFFITPARGDNVSRAAISCGDLSTPWASEDGANGTEFDDGNLHHMVGTIDADSIALYIDGELQAITPLDTNNRISAISTTYAYLAKAVYTADPTWRGEILEFNMYNKALSAEEVLFLFNETDVTFHVVTNGGFENSDTGVVENTDVEGWLIQVADGITPLPVFEIVSDTVAEGSRALKVTVDGLGTNQWDMQIIADSLHVQPNVLYNYSIWAKSEVNGAQVNFTVGNYSFAEYSAIRPATLTNQWAKYTMQFTVTDNQTYVRAPIHFNYTASTGKTIYIDNLEIVANMPDTGNVYEGPPLAAGQPKFVGNIYSAPQIENFASYWNEVIPENAGKWGSVEGTRDNMNWGELDAAYNLAKDNGFPFNFHVLIWGAQQPGWINELSSGEQLEEITEWFEAVAERYQDIDYLQVVNEPLVGHNPPDGNNGRANYKDALGGDGETGYDWVITAFRMAREIFPADTKLMINDFNIINNSSSTATYLNIINNLKEDDLIDVIGEQGHAFTTTAPVITMLNNLNTLATSGLPIQITELDIDGPTDQVQLQDYQRIFPALYEHPYVEGITLWGWRPGLWRNDQGAYLINEDETERPALIWLRDYLDTVTVNPVSAEGITDVPYTYSLSNNYPNPFNPSTTIRYSIAQTSKVTLKIYDILGKEVETLANEVKAPGQYNVIFNARDLASGIYFYQINAGSFTATKKLILLK